MMTCLTRLAWQRHKYDFKHSSQPKAIAQRTHTHSHTTQELTKECDKLAGAPLRVTLQLIWELRLDL